MRWSTVRTPVRLFVCVTAIALLLCFPADLLAQLATAEEKGLPPNSVFHLGDVDAVNLQNGNLHISIPILNVKERGGQTLSWGFVYDNPGWTKKWLLNDCPPSAYSYTVDANSTDPQKMPELPCPTTGAYTVGLNNHGAPDWRFTNPTNWTIGSTGEEDTCPIRIDHTYPISPGVIGGFYEYDSYVPYTNWYVYDPQGTAHPVPIRTEAYLPDGATSNSQCQGSNTSGPAGDGSGLFINVDSGTPFADNNVTMYTKGGTQILSNPFKIRDANGNLLTYSGNTLSDTQGRNPITLSYNPGYDPTDPTQTPLYTMYTVQDSNGGPEQYRVDYVTVSETSAICNEPFPLNPSVSCTDVGDYAREISKITLPDQKTYLFTYNANSPGELASITLPSGATISYTYAPFYQNKLNSKGLPPTTAGGSAVASRTVTVDGRAYLWQYGLGVDGGTNTVTDPDGNIQVHNFSPVNATFAGTLYPSSSQYETSVLYKDPSGNLLRTVQTDYIADFDQLNMAATNVRPIRTTTTLDNGLMQKKETDYESFSFPMTYPATSGTGSRMNVSEVREFDYGSGAPSTTLLRKTDYTYLHNNTTNGAAYVALNVVDRPLTVTTYNGSGAMLAQSVSEYDNYSRSSQLMQPSGAVQHDPAYGTSFLTRGNLTATSHWLNTDNSYIRTTNQYDDAGNLLSTIDPLGHPTTFDFSDSWADATCAPALGPARMYPKIITNAMGQSVTTTYNSCTGTPASSLDANGHITSVSYDLLNRPRHVSFPDTGSKDFCYTDDPSGSCSSSMLALITSTTTSPDHAIVTTTVFDGLGRAKQTQSNSDPDGVVYADTVTDDQGKVQSSNNPHRSTSDATYGVTTYAYDALGRPLYQCHPDNGTGSGPCVPGLSYLQWSYNGNVTTSFDENRNQWQRTTDALGRLTSVVEPNGATTTYSYDLLNNLTSVTQSGLSGETPRSSRSFTYDSLSRLITSTNPETGTICYGLLSGGSCTGGYDADGNLTYKTDARGIYQHYTYDVLNRILAKTYSDATPSVAYTYDTSSIAGATNTVGRLTSETVTSGTTVISQRLPYAYDAMGRLNQLLECTPVNCSAGDPYHLAFTYDLAGNVIQSTNGIPNAAFTGNPTDLSSHYGNASATFNGIAVPSTMLTAGYDGAVRLNMLTSSWADAGNHPATLFQATSTDPSAPAYGPVGLANAVLGYNPINSHTVATMARAYDNRLRLISENDIGAVSQGTLTEGSTGSIGSITIGGTEDNQITQVAAPASGQITIYGTEHSHQVCTGGGLFPLRCNTFPDFGTLSVSINGFNASATYGVGSDDPTVAQALATALSASGSPVMATTGGTTTVTMTSIATGTSANYAYTITCAIGSDFCGTVSGSTLTGGTNAGIVYDAGTISATINGSTVSVPWNSTSNANGIASALASAIQSADSGFLRLTRSGPTITLYSNTPGAAANWSVLASADDSTPPTTPSFSVTTSGMSGGTNGTVTPGLLYGYSIPTTGGFAPNGNLMNVSDTVMGSWSYGYDNLNRLSSAVAGSGSYMGNSIDGATLGWQYDSFGNRKMQTSNFTGFPTGSVQFTGANNQATGTGLASPPTVSVDTLQYDAAGNLSGKDGITNSLYDGEGRLCATANTTGGYTQYIYDGDGNRVAKGSTSTLSCNLASFSATNSYVLGQGGEQLTEMNLQSGVWRWDHSNVFASTALLATYSNPASGSETTFALNDWLGTKRVEITPDGKISSFASLPFGDGLTSLGTAADATEHHFTGKERDAESGLDYFGARYYVSNMSRWASPDGPLIDQQEDNPQSWNLYSYGRNGPLIGIDADGHQYTVCDKDGNNCVPMDDPTFEGDEKKDKQNGEYFQHGSIFHLDADGNHIQDGTYHWDGPDMAGDAASNIAAVGQISTQSMGAIKYFVIGSAVGGTLGGGALAAGLFGGSGAGLTMLEPLTQAGSLVGRIIGWGKGQAGAAATLILIAKLTPENVQEMVAEGLQRGTVQKLLNVYETNGWTANANLAPRAELMRKILEFWPTK